MTRTDFSLWDRKTLEQFAREAADDNLQLRADLATALGGFRSAVVATGQEKFENEADSNAACNGSGT